jgi:hypothetical protein
MPAILFFLTKKLHKNNSLFFAGLLVLILSTACSSESSRLKVENDSLRNQLASSNQVISTLRSVNILLDSIDIARHSIHSMTLDGNKAKYPERMEELKEYIKRTEEKIKELESSFVDNDVNKESYMMMIDALKDELKFRQEEAGIMEKTTSIASNEDLQNVQLSEIEKKLEAKKSELKALELRIKELVRTMNISEADSYFAQAAAVEEAAKRTKLAPHKRKQTFQEALDLYDKALKLGKKEAKAKVEELKLKVGKEDNDLLKQ